MRSSLIPTRLAAALCMAAITLCGCDDSNGSPAGAEDDGNGGKADDAEDAGAGRLDPVDIAFLIPPPRNGGQPKIRMSETGAGGVLLPESGGFFDVLSAEGLGFNREALGMPNNIYPSLAVTGVRYDPCAPKAFHGLGNPTPATDCEEEFRLVVQPWTGVSFSDAAIHLVHRVPEGEGANLRKRLRAMKAACAVDTSTVSVGPHPCLAGDGSTDAFLEEHVRPLVLAHAGSSLLKGAATMVTIDASGGGRIEWHWRLFFVSPQTSTLQQVPMLPNVLPADVMVFRNDGTVEPQPTSEFEAAGGRRLATANLQRITPDGAFTPARFTEDEATIDALLTAYGLENPRITALPDAAQFLGQLAQGMAPPRVEGMDCAACHVQSPALTVFESNVASSVSAELTAAIDAVKYPATLPHLEATRALHRRILVPGRTNYIVINFGFLSIEPSVNRRTANEAEDAARFINEVLNEGPTEPEDTDGEPGETDGEPEDTDGEPAETGTEPAETGTEPVETGTEPAESGSESGGGGEGSCANRCDRGFDESATCQCDATCATFGDCCSDFASVCQD